MLAEEGKFQHFQPADNAGGIYSTMLVQGKARVGHKAPDFHCDAVVAGTFEGELATKGSMSDAVC